MKLRYHWTFKLLALILAVVSGAAIWLGGACLILDDLGYYKRQRQSMLYSDVESYLFRAGEAVFDRFAWQDTSIEPKLFERFFRWGADVDAAEALPHAFYYEILDDGTNQRLDSNLPIQADLSWSVGTEFNVRRGSVTVMPKAEYYPNYGEFTDPAEGMIYTDLEGNPLPALAEHVTDTEYYVVSEDSSVNWENISRDSYHHSEANGADYTIYRMEYTGYERYIVNTYMTEDQAAALLDVPMGQERIPRLLRAYDHLQVPLVIYGLIGLLFSLLWLTLTAGGSPRREELKPEGLNVIPLDLYLAAAALGVVFVIVITGDALYQVVQRSAWSAYDGSIWDVLIWDIALFALLGGGTGLLLAMFLMACAAQMKVGNNYWLKHTLIGMCWLYGRHILTASVTGLWALLKRFGRWMLSFFAGIGKGFSRLMELLPLTWQWLLVSAGLWLLMIVCVIFTAYRYLSFWVVPAVLATALLVLYGAWCFGQLRDAAKRMSDGDLDAKIDSKYLMGCFGEFAGHLNALGDTCIESAKQQMKSERMKSELITNVSHDIKTPLTSIINYVDLLQMTDDEQQRAEYLEVLDRQSQRLKKLIEDLMEMSRANSGNLAVEITPTDVCEAVNQALGEFADTLDRCGLSVLCRTPQEPVMAQCDGKHLWRVLSNILSNVVKYAMPGTRVYVDVALRGQKAEISVKNISAKMLNISAEELMERFVRGDSSRNTEGNGLGLNIAKSLMELQGGKLELVVDGDLFKVVLTLNAA